MADDPIRPTTEAAVPVPSSAAAPEPLVEGAVQPPPVAGTPTPSPVSLWLPRDLAIASALLGFPGGFGLLARNAWRLGRPAAAWTFLLVGAAIVLAIFFALPEDVPRGAVIAINLVVVVALVMMARGQIRVVERRGRTVGRASAAGGIATFIGGWVATAGPTFLIAFALTFLGAQAQAIRAGTVQFGSAGSACEVDAPASAVPVDSPLRYVAHLSRDVNAGETVHFSLLRGAGTEIHSQDLLIESVAGCVSGTIPPRTLSAGTYVFEFTTGTERVAIGEVTITGP